MTTEAMLPPRRAAVGPARLVGSLALFLAGFVAAAPAGVEIRSQRNLIAVRATDVSLRAVLEAVAESCNVDIRSNTAMLEPITVDTVPRPLPQLLRSLLRDHSYVLQYGGGGADAQRLWVLAPADGDGDANHARSASRRDHSLDEIVRDLADPDSEVRIEAVLALGDAGGDEIVPFLMQSVVQNRCGRSGLARRARSYSS